MRRIYIDSKYNSTDDVVRGTFMCDHDTMRSGDRKLTLVGYMIPHTLQRAPRGDCVLLQIDGSDVGSITGRSESGFRVSKYTFIIPLGESFSLSGQHIITASASEHHKSQVSLITLDGEPYTPGDHWVVVIQVE